MNTEPAIAVLEFSSVAAGIHVADAMVKRAPIQTLRIGTVQPGKYLVLVGGSVAAVDESHAEGMRLSGELLIDEIFLPDVHEQVYDSIGGKRRTNRGDALGVIETASIPAVIVASDKAVKTANVAILEIRLGDGLGGKGVTYLAGKVEDVAVAIQAGIDTVGDRTSVQSVVIPAQHVEIRDSVGKASSFSD